MPVRFQDTSIGLIVKQVKSLKPNSPSKHLTSKGSIALRAGRANARRCFGSYV